MYALLSLCLTSTSHACCADLQGPIPLFNPETSSLIQKRHPYTRNLNSETPGDSKNAFLHWGDILKQQIVVFTTAGCTLETRSERTDPCVPCTANASIIIKQLRLKQLQALSYTYGVQCGVHQ